MGTSKPTSPEEFSEYADSVFEKLAKIPIIVGCDMSWQKNQDFFQQK